jgi:hypothetical protein
MGIRNQMAMSEGQEAFNAYAISKTAPDKDGFLSLELSMRVRQRVLSDGTAMLLV